MKYSFRFANIPYIENILSGIMILLVIANLSMIIIYKINNPKSIPSSSHQSSSSNKIDICRCLTEPGNTEWSRNNENNCDSSINDYLGFNWKTTNFSLKKNKSKKDKWDQLASQCTSSSSSSSYQSSSSSRRTENTDYEKKVCQDPSGKWHSHISTCATCGTSYCVEYLQYGEYCSQGCCRAIENYPSSKCGD